MKTLFEVWRGIPAFAMALVFTGQVLLPPAVRADSPHRWTTTLNNPAENGTDEGHGIAFTADGGVVVAGRTHTAEEGFNVWLGRFSPSGALLWSTIHDGPWSDIDEAWDVAVGPEGGIYVTGRTWVPGQNYDLWLARFTPEGTLLWEKTYGGPAGGKDEGRAVAVGPDGTVHVAGGVTFNGSFTDLWIGAFSSDGDLLRQNSFDGGASGKDTGYGVAPRESGGAYASGSVTSPDGRADIWAAGLTGLGVPEWQKTVPRELEGHREGRSAAVGADGGLLIAGSVPSPEGGYRIWIGSFSPEGELLWETTAAEDFSLRARGMATGQNGKIYVVGTVQDPLEDSNIWVGRFNRHGKKEKAIVLDGGEGLPDEATAVAFGRPNDLAITGFMTVPGEAQNIWVWKSRGTVVRGDQGSGGTLTPDRSSPPLTGE